MGYTLNDAELKKYEGPKKDQIVSEKDIFDIL